MTKGSLANLVALGTLLAACAACAGGDTSHGPTAPRASVSLSETPGELAATYSADGALEPVSPLEDAIATMAAAAPQAASGNRSTGHVGFPTGITGTIITSERYSYTALRTDPATPFAAKGQYELELTTTAGITQRIQGDVICMLTFGNTARVAGQINKLWINGVPSPILPGRTHNI